LYRFFLFTVTVIQIIYFFNPAISGKERIMTHTATVSPSINATVRSTAITKKKAQKRKSQGRTSVYRNQNRLAPLPSSKSRKCARRVTTLFHRYTHLKEKATSVDEHRQLDGLIEQIGGQKGYQRASQISTSYHSTSKWVLGCLARNGWLYGIVDRNDCKCTTTARTEIAEEIDAESKLCRGSHSRRMDRRPTRLLEIGAINTELLDAAAATVSQTTIETAKNENGHQQYKADNMKYRLQVRSIDLHSMHEGIEEIDFLSIPLLNNDDEQRYDVIVCSMVLNCVPTPIKRGEMMLRMVHYLRPGGLVYVTIPKTCLRLSPYIDMTQFQQIMHDIGLEVINHSKETPKLFYFIGQKRMKLQPKSFDVKWTKLTMSRKGKKYRNDFAVILPSNSL
jgi:25S rRNA (adenine2142-N1)-methyltransferase